MRLNNYSYNYISIGIQQAALAINEARHWAWGVIEPQFIQYLLIVMFVCCRGPMPGFSQSSLLNAYANVQLQLQSSLQSGCCIQSTGALRALTKVVLFFSP